MCNVCVTSLLHHARACRLPTGVLFMYHPSLGIITDVEAAHYGVSALGMAHVGLPWAQVCMFTCEGVGVGAGAGAGVGVRVRVGVGGCGWGWGWVQWGCRCGCGWGWEWVGVGVGVGVGV